MLASSIDDAGLPVSEVGSCGGNAEARRPCQNARLLVTSTATQRGGAVRRSQLDTNVEASMVLSILLRKQTSARMQRGNFIQSDK